MNQSKKLTDGALLAAIYTVLLLITLIIPFIFPIFLFLLPVPIIIYAAKYDWKPASMMFIAILILSTIIATVFSLPTSIVMGLGGIMLGTAIKRKLTPYETWARGTIGFVIGLVIILIITVTVLGVNLHEEYNLIIQDSLQMSKAMLEQFGLAERMETVEEVMLMIPNLLPVGLVLAGLILAFVSQWLSYKILNRLEKRDLRYPKFYQLRFPVSLIWIYFFSFIVLLFSSDPNSMISIGMNNVLLLVGFFMILQGFSFTFYYFHAKKKSITIPIIITVVAVIFPLALQLIQILGIIDIGFRLRDRIVKQ